MGILNKTLKETYHTARCAAGWAFLAAETSVFATGVIVCTFLPDGGKTAYRIGRLWSQFNLWLMGAKLVVEGLERIDRKRPYVVMVNHQSHLDVWTAAAALPIQPRWLMKQELRKVPLFGYACERIGNIYVDRGNPESTKASMETAADRIRSGTSVLFFPEGTRSRTDHLGSFKTGGFRLAVRAGAPILPVTISGTRKLLPPDTWKYYPGRIRVVFAEPIPTRGLVAEDIPDLMDRTRTAMQAGLLQT